MRLGLIALFTLVSVSAYAQNGSPPAPRRPAPDFLFGQPQGSITVRGGWMFARAGSDWYRFVTAPNQLTIDRSDFNAPGIATDLAIHLTSRADAVFGVEFTRSSMQSEYRQLVDNNRQPITQSTQLSQVNLMGSVKYALTERGQSISTFAWVPRNVVPYIGAGGGVLWYRLRQAGDFVDQIDPIKPVFTDVLESSAWTPAAHVFGGVDVRVWRRVYATMDVRYLWAAGEMQRPFEGFNALDLAGLRTSAGVNLLF